MTLIVLKDALAMFAMLTFALAIEALLRVASPRLAFGMVAVPVNTGLSMGAFNKFKEASATTRSFISWLMTDVKSDKCATMSELPTTMPVIKVL